MTQAIPEAAPPKRGRGLQERAVPIAAAQRAVSWLRALIVYRLHGVHVGTFPGVKGRLPQLHVRGTMRAGERFTIRASQFPVQITVRPRGELTLGDRVFLNQGTNILAASSVRIGSDCQIGDLAAIRDTDTHQVEPGRPATVAPVNIGNNVWIGRGALIMPGVTIGDHAVIAAGAVVTQDVPERTVAAGVPAKPIRTFEVPDPNWRRP